MTPVFVFKTSVTTPAEVVKIKPLLDKLIQQGERWNFDLQDCDNILRMETKACDASRIIHVLNIAGYDCTELQD